MKTFYKIILLLVMLVATKFSAMAQSSNHKLGKSVEVANTYKNKLKSLRETGGDNRITHQVPGQNPLVLKVKAGKKEGKADVFIGEVEGKKYSTFFLRVEDAKLEGFVILKEQKKAYKYVTSTDGVAYLEEVDIDKVVCTEYLEGPSSSGGTSNSESTTTSSYPTELQSLPGASAVVLLDFNGQYVKDSYWNNGGEINAAPANLSSAEMVEVWKLISEDFSPFAINITTNEAVYLNAPANRRMRVIFTPTDFFQPGSGGVAYVDSFTWGNETPCWVFNSTAKYAGEAGAHEIGHTLGLSHDGRTSPSEAYFYGQGSWAPIMGAGYYSEQVQWSSGEYPYANNREDDCGIITNKNGFGYRTDDHSNVNTNATPLVASSTSIATRSGFISSRTDIDVFSFETSGGNVEISVNPAVAYANLDVLLSLRDASNNTIISADPAGTSASITQSLQAGTYYVHVKGAKGALGADSDYGSVGNYTVEAKFNGQVTATNVARLNTGSKAYTDNKGQTWNADSYFSGGTTSSKSFDVQGTTDDALYLSYRLAASGSPFGYSIPISDGNYNVRLHFIEPYFGAPGGQSSNLTGARIFHVDIEGKRVLNNYDIYSQDGAGKAVVKYFDNISVTGGTLDLSFTSVVNNAIISAIEILPASSSFALTTNVVGSGSITKSPLKLSYAPDETVTLTATPASGYQFTGWSGNATGTTNPLSVLMDGNKTITANFAPLQQSTSLISEITTTTGRSYSLGELVINTKIYTDRTYQATSVPALLEKASLLLTANDDKKSVSGTVLSFKLNQPATVYVAYDPRATALPAWLGDWVKVPERIGVNDTKISHMDLYRKSFPAGTVSLGGNMQSPASGAQNNYFVVAKKTETATALVTNISCSSGRSYLLGELATGITHYTDRTYKISSVPPSLSGTFIIRTANADKGSTASSLSFTLSQNATVYVAYDPRATSLPAWLSGWQKVPEQIGVNDTKISHMNLYSKSYPAGSVSLGANFASPAKGAENNYFVVVQAQASTLATVGQAQDIGMPINEQQSALKLMVYPNPNAGDKIHLSISNAGKAEMVTIDVHDILGRFVTTSEARVDERGTANTELRPSERLSRGLYIINIKAGHKTVQQKLLVE